MSVSLVYAPEEEAIASKACAKYISLIQIVNFLIFDYQQKEKKEQHYATSVIMPLLVQAT